APIEASLFVVMAGLVPAIHVLATIAERKTWIPATSAGMKEVSATYPSPSLPVRLAFFGERLRPFNGILAGIDLLVEAAGLDQSFFKAEIHRRQNAALGGLHRQRRALDDLARQLQRAGAHR